LTKHVTIKNTPFALRPREKFKKYGSLSLTNDELLAILLGSGIEGKNVSEISKSIIKKYSSNIVNTDYKELMKEKGIGEVKAIQLECSFELVKRLIVKDDVKKQIISPKDLESDLQEYKNLKKEHLIAFYLSPTNHLLFKEVISIGTVDTSLIHPREIIAPALEHRATAIILAHNHPFGNSNPSAKDIEITKTIDEACKLMGLALIDHLIVSNDGIFSLREKLNKQNQSEIIDNDFYTRQGAVQKSLFDFYYDEPMSVKSIISSMNIKSKSTDENKININQRRYLGNKHNVLNLIDNVMEEKIPYFDSLCDIFGGTGSVGHHYNTNTNKIITNDLLYSNYLSLHSFLGSKYIDELKLAGILYDLNNIKTLNDNYVSQNFGDRYFSLETAKKIGEIREKINRLFLSGKVNFDEKAILLTSLLYAMDRVANTVGHYDAFIKKEIKVEKFVLKMPNINYDFNSKNEIYNLDANTLIRQIECDVLYLDPPYNSRQYSDSYHLLENIMRWEKPEVHGEAKKFDRTHLKSEYSLKNATKAFADLIQNAKCKYILFSYNNMADKGNNRSNARIRDEDIFHILSQRGKPEIFEQDYKEFTTGKSDRGDNKERVFFVAVQKA
jgi:adenine-specific DNA-methyltransferase